MHALAVIHLVAMVGLLFWWSMYFWQHSPTREIFALRSPTTGEGAARLYMAALQQNWPLSGGEWVCHWEGPNREK
jgi:hypothetical protein